MARYPTSQTEHRIDAVELASTVTGIFTGCGMTVEDACLLTDSLVEADLRGIHSHGVLRVPDYVDKLTSGGVDPRGRPVVVRDRGGALVVNGNNSMGQIGGVFAMELAVQRARAHGTAAVAVGGSNHAGTMEFFVRRALRQDMIGIATTNALPTMAPWGGRDKIIGLNPIGIGIPGGEEGPIVLDVALGATAHGKIRVYDQKREPLPEGWAFDASGQPTTDASAALAGLIQPIGAFKGLGLAVCMGVLSSLLSGSGYGTESGNMVDGALAGRDGQFYLAIDVAAFEEPDVFRQRVDRVIREIRTSRPTEGTKRIYAPGMLEAEIEARHRESGIPLNDETVRGVIRAARRFGVRHLLEP